jgi:DNA-binding transcriptional LysR family regulator
MNEYLDFPNKAGISLERLAALCRVVDQGGISKAAGGEVSKISLYSKQIKDLERALGVELTRRVGRLAVPSPAARRLAAIVRDHFKALASFAAEAKAVPTTVTLGASNSLLEWVVLPRIPALQRALRGKTTISLLASRSRDLVEALLDRQCDVGLVRSTAVGRGLRTRPLTQFGYALFVPEALGRGKGAAEILKTAPLATAVGGEFRQQLEAAASTCGIDLSIALECPSFAMAASAVQRGSCAAILPGIAVTAFEGSKVHQWALPFKIGPGRKIVLAAHPHVDEKIVDAVAGALAVRTSASTR